MSVDTEYFIKEALEKALEDNPDYAFIRTNKIVVKIDRGEVTVQEYRKQS